MQYIRESCGISGWISALRRDRGPRAGQETRPTTMESAVTIAAKVLRKNGTDSLFRQVVRVTI
jgi:hypothetical protein